MSDFYFIVLLVAIGLAIYAWIKKDQTKTARREIENIKQKIIEKDKEISDLSTANVDIKNKLTRNLMMIEKKEELFQIWNSELSEKAPKIAHLIADYETLYMDISARFLERKKRPAIKEAKRIREIKKESRLILSQQRLTEYKICALIDLFPELEIYLEDFASLEDLAQLNSVTDLMSTHDRVRDYISPSDYKKLPEDERNQLALDNYISGHKKSNWQIGRDYEMSVGHEYSSSGWEVEYTGIIDGLKDLGRDLICRNGAKTKIVQCKYWSAKKQIHEKHIFQLYGTTVLFNLSRGDLFEPPAIPVFITNTKLSASAMKFAKALDIEIYQLRPMKEYPRIKCNVGTDENGNTTKIYHLPMDQHYDRTQLLKKTDFYANTVAEAAALGFRRSYRWRPTPD